MVDQCAVALVHCYAEGVLGGATRNSSSSGCKCLGLHWSLLLDTTTGSRAGHGSAAPLCTAGLGGPGAAPRAHNPHSLRWAQGSSPGHQKQLEQKKGGGIRACLHWGMRTCPSCLPVARPSVVTSIPSSASAVKAVPPCSCWEFP